jgi:hypothetical protein
MIVYNTTVKVEAAIAAEWLRWLNDEHAPEMLATGCFWKYQVLHLFEQEDADGPTYAIQYFAHTPADYQHYLSRYAAALQKKIAARWGNRLVSFSTAMQVVGG